MAYLYETHLHTVEASKCAVSSGADYIAGYKEKGYAGIIVTDHFYNANCSIPVDLPWEEWVNRFCKGYETAKEEGERLGLDVFFGWEENFDNCDDYLVYGLGKEWLLEHPEVKTWTRAEQHRAVRDAGGCVVQAHPFRQRWYISKVVLSTQCVDAVEAANGGNDDFSFDAFAWRYAKKIKKPIIAGTDIHNASEIYNFENLGVYSDKKLESVDDFVRMILNNDIAGIKADKSRFKLYGGEKVELPVEILGKKDKIISRRWKEYI